MAANSLTDFTTVCDEPLQEPYKNGTNTLEIFDVRCGDYLNLDRNVLRLCHQQTPFETKSTITRLLLETVSVEQQVF